MPQEYRLILKHIDAPGYSNDLECYRRHGGYETLRKALALPAPLANIDAADAKERTPYREVVCPVPLADSP